MKYSIVFLLALSFCLQAGAQTQTATKAKSTSTTKKKTAPKPAAPVKEITVTIKSLCEKQVAIYAGLKEGLKKPKLQILGGLSTNTLHIKTSDVVCIMSGDGKKTLACTNLKATTTLLEVNSSGTDVKSK